jgi:hypothetical protein
MTIVYSLVANAKKNVLAEYTAVRFFGYANHLFIWSSC